MCVRVWVREREGGGRGEEGDVVAYGARTISQADRQTDNTHKRKRKRPAYSCAGVKSTAISGRQSKQPCWSHTGGRPCCALAAAYH